MLKMTDRGSEGRKVVRTRSGPCFCGWLGVARSRDFSPLAFKALRL